MADEQDETGLEQNDAPLEQNDGRQTPSAWQKARFPDSDRGRPHPDRFKHGAAAALHGWDLHAYHTGEELRLSEADYDAALTAAMSTSHELVPHDAALSPVLREMNEKKEDR